MKYRINVANCKAKTNNLTGTSLIILFIHYITCKTAFNVIDIFVNRSWVDTRWQQYSTHLHTNSTQNDTN